MPSTGSQMIFNSEEKTSEDLPVTLLSVLFLIFSIPFSVLRLRLPTSEHTVSYISYPYHSISDKLEIQRTGLDFPGGRRVGLAWRTDGEYSGVQMSRECCDGWW